MTVTQTVKIPANRRVIFNVPSHIPTGATARFELVWSPKIEKTNDFKASLAKIRALCKDAPFSVDSLREERRRDNEIEESRYRRFLGEGN